ncbi:hypothetical protein BGZ51_005476 [Haplosporangium sp. Z 767]|nr:hypothetical protein BGZ51_005476 [Haplosporangium sp. Z 767]
MRQSPTSGAASGDADDELVVERDTTTQRGTPTAMKRLQSKSRPDGWPIKVFHITYSYQHNHAVAIDTDLRAQYLSDEKKAAIEQLLQTGSPVRDVLQRMRGSAEKLLQNGKRRTFRGDIIIYEDVYSTYYGMTAKEIHKNKPDLEASAHMWMEELETDQFYTCHETGISYAFSSSWQLKQLSNYGKIFCFYGIHIFPLVHNELHRALYTPGKDRAFALLSAFQETHRNHPEMLQLLDRNYSTERELRRWMVCFRGNPTCAVIDTNNYGELWHNVLKMYFLKDKQRKRVDAVIYTLVKSYTTFYQSKLLRGQLHVRRLNPIQRAVVDSRTDMQEQNHENMTEDLGRQDGEPMLADTNDRNEEGDAGEAIEEKQEAKTAEEELGNENNSYENRKRSRQEASDQQTAKK